jgi:uncharacterized Rmd1/YagE family protein
VRALLLGERLPLSLPERARARDLGPATVRIGGAGRAVLLRYGAVVLFDATPAEEVEFLHSLAALPKDAPRILDSEDGRVVIDAEARDGVGPDGEIRLRSLSPERLQVVADVLAKSAVLAYYEARVAAAFDRVEPLAAALRRGRSMREGTRALLRYIGDVLGTEHRMVGRVEVTETPEVLWDRPELEPLYLQLAREYELRARDRALARKLELISRTASTVLELTQTRRSLRVEWYIVILIVVEILLTLYEMLLGPGA